MRGRSHCVAFMLLFSAAVCNARAETDGATPAFTNVPELASGFRSLYIQNFTEAREKFSSWETEHPDANDAYVALGAANYIIGSLSGGTRFLLRFGGIHGDKKLGMEQLGKTIESGRYLKPFAKILLALAARRQKQDDLAQRLLRELSEEFPESPLYAAEYAKAMGRPIPAQMHP